MTGGDSDSREARARPGFHITRRTFAGGVAALAATPALAEPADERPKPGDFLVAIDDAGKTPLTPDDIKAGAAQVQVWPFDPELKIARDGSRLNKAIVVRVDPVKLADETRPRAVEGVVAYSAICPHGGCDVTNFIPGQNIFECPCHNSQYDPADGARVVDGPTPKALAALPLKLVDGKLAVAAPFTSRVGVVQT